MVTLFLPVTIVVKQVPLLKQLCDDKKVLMVVEQFVDADKAAALPGNVL